MEKLQQIDTSISGILKVALPISLSTFVQFVVVFTDNFFLSDVSKLALNAAGNSGILYVAFMMIAVGLSSGVQILTARRKGEQKHEEAGSIFSNALIMAFLIGIGLYLFTTVFRIYGLPHLVQDPELAAAMDSFLRIRFFGYMIHPLVLCFIGFYSGIAQTRVLFYITVIMAIVNVLGDYVLIFGNSFIPAMGLDGASYASFFSEIFALIFVVIYSARNKANKIYEIGRSLKTIPFRSSRKILKVSIPIMGQQFLALATWTSFFLMVERMGEDDLYISQLTRSIYFLAFVILFGIGQTTKTYVSTLIAEGRQKELNPLMAKLILMNLCGLLLTTHGLLLYPKFLLGIFSDDPYVLETGTLVLRVVFGATVLFAFAGVFLNAIEGAGKTNIAFWIEFACIVSYIIIAYFMIFTWQQPIERVWMMDWLYFGLMGVLSFFYLWKAPWKYTQV